MLGALKAKCTGFGLALVHLNMAVLEIRKGGMEALHLPAFPPVATTKKSHKPGNEGGGTKEAVGILRKGSKAAAALYQRGGPKCFRRPGE